MLSWLLSYAIRRVLKMHWQLVAALASGILGLVMNNFPVELENL